jgi:hypothetical protein
MFRDPMKSSRKIRKSKSTSSFDIRTFRFYRKQILGIRKQNITRRLFKGSASKPGLLSNISKRVKRSDQCAGVRCNGIVSSKGANLFANSVAEIGEAGATLDSDVKTKAWDFPLSFFGAIMGLQEFTSKEIRNRILRSFYIFNIKLKST